MFRRTPKTRVVIGALTPASDSGDDASDDVFDDSFDELDADEGEDIDVGLQPDGMILSKHPDGRHKGKKAIGFWRGGYGNPKTLPDPHDFVDTSWDPVEREVVAHVLESAPTVERYRGWSTCRICGKHCGSTDQGDGTYVWPEGFAHYVRDHSVKPPDEFLAHVAKTRKDSRSAPRPERRTRGSR